MYRTSAAVFAAAFAALAALVATGAFTRVDQWSIDRLMPGSSFHHEKNGLLQGLIPLYQSHWANAYGIAANIVTLPAAFLVSLAIVAACSRLLSAALVAAVAVEVVCKEVLVRPALHDGPYHVVAFNSSFPSGHTLRTVLVAAAVAWTWPRLRVWAAAWAVAAIVLLELAGWHTPTDIAGGLLLGGLALLGARAAGALRARRLAARRP